ncbi:ATP-binding cassette domain-containing protein [Roseiflexus sp.]|uniref:ATP-binding cassette domain-containing protein n=1 Tax=Roseiflexus sp. TaxID=2562120 RepID=UPI00398B4C8B
MSLVFATWPAARLDEAAEMLAIRAGLASAPAVDPLAERGLPDLSEEALGRWLTARLFRLGLEVESVEITYPEVETFLRQAGPALIRVSGKPAAYLAVLRSQRQTVIIISPDGRQYRLPIAQVRAALCAGLEASVQAVTDQFLNEIEMAPGRLRRVQAALFNEQLRDVRIGGSWLIRLAPSADLWTHLRRSRLFPFVGVLAGAFAVEQLLLAGGWAVIGRAVLYGDLSWVSAGAWFLLLLTAIPFQILNGWAQNRFALNAGVLFRDQLLNGMLRLSPDQIRHQGAGSFLGRVMEAEAFETLTLGGGFLAVIALFQVGLAAVVLALGAGGWLQTLLLLLWLMVSIVLLWRYAQRARAWIETYRAMTADLVERMIGQRTRLVQEDRAHWHDEEDSTLYRYTELSRQLDSAGVGLQALITRGWFIVGILGLLPAFLSGRAGASALGIGVGGTLLAAQAFQGLVSGVVSLTAAWLAWGQISPLLRAARSSAIERAAPLYALPAPVVPAGQALLIGRDLGFRYHERQRSVLQQCHVTINNGDRILLEGSSGSGKSTLAAILAGLRQPQTGLLLLRGFDLQTIGDLEWRRRVVVAPQFHENHIFTETFAFNLLMGRGWPPTEHDLRDAEAVCAALGLDDLLARMPAGMQQMIGEGGWQLSHGERSRLFLARALLQRADIIILDESFAALDPELLQQALMCARQMAPTLVVIAHP